MASKDPSHRLCNAPCCVCLLAEESRRPVDITLSLRALALGPQAHCYQNTLQLTEQDPHKS